jgi:hypothetical protein
VQLIVITAFNIFGRNGDDWLIPRMQMFKEVCLPSMLAQTDKDFLWLILVDGETPRPTLHELLDLLPFYAHIEAVCKESINQMYRGESGGAVSTLAQPVNHMPRIMGHLIEDDWVATVPCHADDAMSAYFVEVTKGLLREKEETIAFTEGALKVDAGIPNKDGYYRVTSDIFFCVRVEQKEKFESVFYADEGRGGSHRYKDEKRHVVTEKPMWLWHLHGLLQNCHPNSNFKMVNDRTPYTYEDVKRRFNYKGSE